MGHQSLLSEGQKCFQDLMPLPNHKDSDLAHKIIQLFSLETYQAVLNGQKCFTSSSSGKTQIRDKGF